MLINTLFKQIVPNAIIIEADNGFDAMEKFKTENPNLIFMDIQMPELDGVDTTIQIRNIEKSKGEVSKTIIVAFTATTANERIENFFKVGMNDYLVKPVTRVALEKIANKWLLV